MENLSLNDNPKVATRPTIPYYTPADQLPAPLPTVAEILASKDFLTTYGRAKIVRVGEHFVVKYGQHPFVRLQEGENMLFVSQSTSVRVPAVYALFHDEKSGNNFIVQERIVGKRLSARWEILDKETKEAIVAQLRRYFDELRSIPSPGYYGGVWRQPILDAKMNNRWIINDEQVDIPACDTEMDWVDRMMNIGNTIHPSKSPARDEWLRHMYQDSLVGSPQREAVFTHGDLDPRNFMIRDEDNSVVIIDWECSGWYPVYWEYCGTMVVQDFQFCGDWAQWVPRFLAKYPTETGWMYHFRTWLMFNY